MKDPERLGKYEIRGALGKGAMGTVYKAFDPHIERMVAIKTIRKALVEPELAAQYMDTLGLPKPRRLDEAVPANLTSGLRHGA